MPTMNSRSALPCVVHQHVGVGIAEFCHRDSEAAQKLQLGSGLALESVAIRPHRRVYGPRRLGRALGPGNRSAALDTDRPGRGRVDRRRALRFGDARHVEIDDVALVFFRCDRIGLEFGGAKQSRIQGFLAGELILGDHGGRFPVVGFLLDDLIEHDRFDHFLDAVDFLALGDLDRDLIVADRQLVAVEQALGFTGADRRVRTVDVDAVGARVDEVVGARLIVDRCRDGSTRIDSCPAEPSRCRVKRPDCCAILADDPDLVLAQYVSLRTDDL